MSNTRLTLSQLDDFVDSAALPIRSQTLVDAWNRSSGDGMAMPAGQVLLLVIMRVQPERALRFEAAAAQFVRATLELTGALSSTLHRAAGDASTWYLVERFADRPTFERHMASPYFREFQLEEQLLLAAPVEAIFLEGSRL